MATAEILAGRKRDQGIVFLGKLNPGFLFKPQFRFCALEDKMC